MYAMTLKRPFGLKLHLMNIVKTSPLYEAMPDYVLSIRWMNM